MAEVSIIIPVYNAGKYILQTIRSVQKQDFCDWELILVDDCSTDNTAEICKSLYKEDNRIQYVRMSKNGGPSAARNRGLDLARGNYLSFIDSDDIVEPHFLSTMLFYAEKHDADIVWCNFIEEWNGISEPRLHSIHNEQVISDKEAITLFFIKEIGLGPLWNKLYRRSFIEKHKIKLNINRVHGEDWEFNFNSFSAGAKVLPIVDTLYHYIRQNNSSVIASYHPTDYINNVRTLQMLRQESLNRNIEFDIKSMNGRFIYNVIVLLQALLHSKFPNKNLEYNKIVHDGFLRELFSSGNYSIHVLPLRYKVYYHLLKHNLNGLVYFLMKCM